ncbi:MAG: anti-sigma factor [Burkholderiales bacterium]|nr:anti-sigma factor [Burkholderiales bacterium]
MRPTEDDLHAYVDDQLSPERRQAVEAYLAQSPEDAARVAAYRAQGAELRSCFNPVLDEPVPQRLTQHAPRRRLARVAAAMAWVAIGVVLGWGASLFTGQQQAGTAGLARRAAVAHAVYTPEVRHPVEVGAEQQEHLVRWLSKRLGADLRPPVLSAHGYELVGGRLLPGDRGAVAQFMYQDARGRRLTLYVTRAPAGQHDTAFRYSREDGVSVFYWVDASLGYALSAELPRASLLEVATAVYKQSNP